MTRQYKYFVFRLDESRTKPGSPRYEILKERPTLQSAKLYASKKINEENSMNEYGYEQRGPFVYDSVSDVVWVKVGKGWHIVQDGYHFGIEYNDIYYMFCFVYDILHNDINDYKAKVERLLTTRLGFLLKP